MSNSILMELYHGRKDPNQDMDDWGTIGPVLLVEGVTVTYGGNLRIKFTGQEDWEFLHEFMHDDMFYYDGVYYGDFSFCSEGIFAAIHGPQVIPVLFWPQKSKHKELTNGN
jgi:hypothetical protein